MKSFIFVEILFGTIWIQIKESNLQKTWNLKKKILKFHFKGSNNLFLVFSYFYSFILLLSILQKFKYLNLLIIYLPHSLLLSAHDIYFPKILWHCTEIKHAEKDILNLNKQKTVFFIILYFVLCLSRILRCMEIEGWNRLNTD